MAIINPESQAPVHSLTWEECATLAKRALRGYRKKVLKAYGVPRGGTSVALLMGDLVELVNTPEAADIIVDDIIDSGRTLARYDHYNKPFIALVDKRDKQDKTWYVFPWEEHSLAPAEDNVLRILEALGEDVSREGLRQTPMRYMKMMDEFLHPPDFELTTFEKESYDQMIVESSIPFFSFCEHHIIPFFGTATIGYIPNTKIVGLSKLPRALDKFARRLQNQERITQQVADYLAEHLDPLGVGVVLKARHLCIEMRGVKKHNVETTTTALRGVFKQGEVREEFLRHIK